MRSMPNTLPNSHAAISVFELNRRAMALFKIYSRTKEGYRSGPFGYLEGF